MIAPNEPLRIANPIYAEIVPRELTYAAQVGLDENTAWYVNADGSLNVIKLMTEFQTFFREHSEHWVTRFQYQGGRSAVAVAGVFAARCEQWRAH